MLRRLLAEPGMLVAPGAYDGVSARLIEAAGFKAAYMTGAGMAASHLGIPDLGLATMTEMVTHARNLTAVLDIPLIADADTGYGNARNAVRTVREYERAGVAGLHLEDQVAPKRCGHLAGKSVVSTTEFTEKIRAASESRSDEDFVLIARTDAIAVNGIDDAIDRANRSAEAGADVLFVEAPKSLDQIHRIVKDVSAPLMFNIVPCGETPELTLLELRELGFKIAILPVACLAPAVQAVELALAALRDSGTLHTAQALSPTEIFKKVGLDEWLEVDERIGAKESP